MQKNRRGLEKKCRRICFFRRGIGKVCGIFSRFRRSACLSCRGSGVVDGLPGCFSVKMRRMSGGWQDDVRFLHGGCKKNVTAYNLWKGVYRNISVGGRRFPCQRLGGTWDMSVGWLGTPTWQCPQRRGCRRFCATLLCRNPCFPGFSGCSRVVPPTKSR